MLNRKHALMKLYRLRQQVETLFIALLRIYGWGHNGVDWSSIRIGVRILSSYCKVTQDKRLDDMFKIRTGKDFVPLGNKPSTEQMLT